MSTPIKTSNTQGASPVLNDLMNRMNAHAQSAMNGATAESPEQAFSRWLEKHAIGADAVRRPEQQPADAAGRPAAQQQNNLAASRAAEQTLARARQLSSQQGARPMQQGVDPNAQADARPAAKARTDQNQAAKTGRREGTPKSSQTEGTDQTEETAKDDNAHAPQAAGEGAADVRELTPPSTIQPGDSASMMAWLASLTHGDIQAQVLSSDEPAQGEDATAGKDADTGVVDLPGKGAGHGRGGMTLDLQAWQGVNGKADVAMEQLAKGALETDPMAGLMSGAAGKAGGFGQILNEASQNVRHESATLNAPFGSPEFPQALAEKVSMWVNTAKDQGPMTAELHLNPADMGPINVKISLDGQSAHVDFAAAALETRQAIEASMSMLSSALSDVGLSLTGGGVSSQTSQQAFEQAARDSGGQTASPSGGRGNGQPEEGDDALSVRQVSAPRPGRVGGLDLYA